MTGYEREYAYLGRICGIDEAGRGPLAGPVVAGAVILPADQPILWLNDSKQLSARRREELYDVIMEKAVAVGVGYASPARIDEINILQATYEAMREAVAAILWGCSSATVPPWAQRVRAVWLFRRIKLLLALDCDVELYKAGRMPIAQFAALPYDRDILTHVYIKRRRGLQCITSLCGPLRRTSRF